MEITTRFNITYDNRRQLDFDFRNIDTEFFQSDFFFLTALIKILLLLLLLILFNAILEIETHILHEDLVAF